MFTGVLASFIWLNVVIHLFIFFMLISQQLESLELNKIEFTFYVHKIRSYKVVNIWKNK